MKKEIKKIKVKNDLSIEFPLGKLLDIEVTGYTYEGLGIGRVNTIPIFVPNLIIGEVASVTITSIKEKYLIGKVKSIIKESKERVIPTCQYNDLCGGCNLAHMSSEAQREFKRGEIINSLKFNNDISKDLIESVTVIGEGELKYRNKARFIVSQGKLGYLESKRHNFLQIDHCELLPEKLNEVLVTIQSQEISCDSIVLRYSKEKVTIIFINSRDESYNIKIDKILEKHQYIEGIVYNINRKDSDEFGEESKILYGSEKIEEKIGDKNFILDIDSFFQVNFKEVKNLYDEVSKFSPIGTKNILDLFCGVGSIGQYIGSSSDNITGVEIVSNAITNARENLKNNKLKGRYILGKSEGEIEKILRKNQFDLIILDPPRRGCHKTILEKILRSKTENIIYVSCNPSTLARDLKILTKKYEVKNITGVDMFPNTYHVETIVGLRRIDT